MGEATTSIDIESKCYEYDRLANDVSLRAFILKYYAANGAHEIDGKVLCENLDHLFKWVKNGEVPAGLRNKKRLSVVPAETT